MIWIINCLIIGISTTLIAIGFFTWKKFRVNRDVTVKALLEHGAILMIIVALVANTLMQNEADLDSQDSHGQTALMLAEEYNHTDTIAVIQAALGKTYKCTIDEKDFKEDEKQFIKERVKNIVLGAIKSDFDLDFVKKIILQEHAEEIVSFDLHELDLKQLPWGSLLFKVVGVEKGSTIVKFKVGFSKPPRNETDLIVYRLIELVVVTIIENLQFIKSIKNNDIDITKDSLVLYVNAEANWFDTECVIQTMNSLRGSLIKISGKAASGEAPSEKEADVFIETLLKNKSDDLKKLMGQNLTPVSIRKIANIIIDSRITEVDFAEVKIEVETANKNYNSELIEMSPQSNWLFPFNYRKLADFPPQVFSKMMKRTRELPKENELWMYFLDNLDIYTKSYILLDHRKELSQEVRRFPTFAYRDILDDYRKQEGTIGGLVNALEKFKDEVDGEERKNSIFQYTKYIKELREKMYQNILDNIFCPSHLPSVYDIEQFQKIMKEKGLKIDQNINMNSFQAHKAAKSFRLGDQLWIFKQQPLMASYAHVVIITEIHPVVKFIHVTTPNFIMQIMQIQATIKEGNENELDESLTFVIHPTHEDPHLICERAKSCINFHYDPGNNNCETFCNGVYGNWNFEVQVLNGAVQNLFKALAELMQLFKTGYGWVHTRCPFLPSLSYILAGSEQCTEEDSTNTQETEENDLGAQMQRRFIENKLILAHEKNSEYSSTSFHLLTSILLITVALLAGKVFRRRRLQNPSYTYFHLSTSILLIIVALVAWKVFSI